MEEKKGGGEEEGKKENRKSVAGRDGIESSIRVSHGPKRDFFCSFFFSFCHCTVPSRAELIAHFSQLHSQEHLADDVVREEVVDEVDEVAEEDIVQGNVEEEQDLNQEVAREEIVEYDGSVGEQRSKEGMEVILIDQETRSQGILIIEEPVVYC